MYPALSLLGLLVLWLAGLMVGWSLVYWGLDQTIGEREPTEPSSTTRAHRS